MAAGVHAAHNSTMFTPNKPHFTNVLQKNAEQSGIKRIEMHINMETSSVKRVETLLKKREELLRNHYSAMTINNTKSTLNQS